MADQRANTVAMKRSGLLSSKKRQFLSTGMKDNSRGQEKERFCKGNSIFTLKWNEYNNLFLYGKFS
jgi:hypothetical protein